MKNLSSGQIVHTSVKQVISRREKNENDCENVQKWKRHVQSVQNCCFSMLNMQIYDVIVALVVVVA